MISKHRAGRPRTFQRQALNRFFPYLFFAAIVAALFPEVIFFHQALANNDNTVLQIPWLHLAAATLSHHAFPFWNSYSFCGQILIGQPCFRIFYPLTFLIAYFLPAHLESAISWRVMLEIFFTLSVYYWVFLKVWKDVPLALFSALVCSICTSALQFLHMDFLVGYLPGLLLYILWDWQERPMSRNVVFLALATALFFVGSFYQHIAYFMVFLSLMSLARCVSVKKARGEALGRLFLMWGASSVLALMLVCVDLVPFLESFNESNRNSVPYQALYHSWGWSIPWYMVFRIMMPHFPGSHSSWALIENSTWINSDEAFPAYGGIATFLFCAIAARRFFRKDTWPWLSAILAIALMSLRTPFSRIPYYFFFGALLHHGRMAVLVPICMAFVAPVGIQLFLNGSRDFKRNCIVQTAVVSVGVYLLAGGLLGRFLSLYSWTGAAQWSARMSPDVMERFKQAGVTFLIGGGLLTLWMTAHLLGKSSSRGFKYGAVMLLALDLLYLGRTQTFSGIFSFRDGSKWYPDNPLTTYLKNLPDRDQYHFNIVYQTPWADTPMQWWFCPNMHIPYGLRNVDGYANYVNGRYAQLATKGKGTYSGFAVNVVTDPKMADLLAVKYLVLGSNDAPAYLSFADPVFTTPQVAVLLKRDPVERFHLACQARRVSDSLNDVLSAVYDPYLDLHKKILLPETASTQYPWDHCQKDASARLEMHEAWSGRLEGEAHLKHPKLLMVTEAYDAGWKAFINGRGVPIYRANYAFQAIELPAGSSRIEMRYRPTHLTLCLFGVGAAVIILTALSLWSLLSRPA